MNQNTFNNDGSFLDRFRQMQKRQDSNTSQEQTSRIRVSHGQSCDNAKKTLVANSLSSQIRLKVRDTKQPTPKKSKLASAFDDGDDETDVLDDMEEPDLDPKTKDAMQKVIIAVTCNGPKAEDRERQRNKSNPAYWFLMDKNSAAYKYFRHKTGQSLEADDKTFVEQQQAAVVKPKNVEQPQQVRKRRNRWGDEGGQAKVPPPSLVDPLSMSAHSYAMEDIPCSSVSLQPPRHLPSTSWQPIGQAAIQPVEQAHEFTAQQLDEECKNKARQIAIKALARLAEKAAAVDDDLDDVTTSDGTWEHKVRAAEMQKTEMEAMHTTTQLEEGKHHLSEFLPPEENAKFMQALMAAKSGKKLDVSEYQQNKIDEQNKGFQLLAKMGWKEGSGLGSSGQGITAPINKGQAASDLRGVGAEQGQQVNAGDDLFDVYRKKMMLAYKHRPNPLNNPRRSYY